MNQSIVAELFSVTFQLPVVINILLKYKRSIIAVSQMESTPKKSLKNEVREQVLVVLFIDNSNKRIYSELVKTLENYYLLK